MRATKGAELCGAGTEVPHGSPDSEAVRKVAAEAGVHVKRTQTGPVQTDHGQVTGGGAVFGAADPGEAAENERIRI